MKRLMTTFAIFVGATVATTSPASAIVSTTNFHLEPSVIRTFDSRSTPLTSGVEMLVPVSPHTGMTRSIVNVTISGATERTWLYFHPCGQQVDRANPAAGFAEPGADQINLAPVDASACMTMFGRAGVIALDQVGYQDGTPGLNYVAADLPAISVTPTAGVTTFNTRVAGVPASATAVVMWVAASAPASGPIAWMLEPCFGGGSLGQQTIVSADRFQDNLLIVPVDAVGNVCLRSITGMAPELAFVNPVGYLAPGATATADGVPYGGFVLQEMPGFVAQTPIRLFDTRDSGAPIADGGVFRYRLTGLPADATSVALNITATGTTGPGYVSAYPCDSERPEVSNVNFSGANETVPNFALVSLGSTAELCFYALRSTHVLVDIAGYYLFDGGDGFFPIAPRRMFDTRNLGPRLAPGAVFERDLTGIVSADATAAVMNLTVTGTAGPGYVTAFPCGTEPPTASNVNYTAANQTRPNLVTVKLPADKRVCFFTLAGAHLLADIAGWYSPSADVGFIDFPPVRVFDTREPAGSPPILADEVIGFTLDDPEIKALAWNLTVTQTAGPGYVTGFPCSSPTLPEVSNVNFTGANQTVANFSILQPDSETDICFYALTQTHLIADEAGVFTVPLPWEVFYDGEPTP